MRAKLGKVAARPTPHGLRVMSYNVLSQRAARRDDYRTNGEAILWPERFPAISEEIIAYDPDILLLQEVDEPQLDEWNQLLSSPPLGMTYRFERKPVEFHGVLVAVKDSIFEIVDEHVEDYNHPEDVPSQGCEDECSGLLLLVEMKDTRARLVIGTTQLCAHLDDEFERARQLLYFVVAAGDFPNRRNVVGSVLGGSFNTTPGSPAYELLETGNIKEHGLSELVARSRRRSYGSVSWRDIQKLENEIQAWGLSALTSCYAAVADEPAFTKWTEKVRDTVDYIFVSKELKPTSVMALPAPTDIGSEPNSLPRSRQGKGHPSDHLPLVANVQLLSTEVKPEPEESSFSDGFLSAMAEFM